jgi:hypothetical protein
MARKVTTKLRREIVRLLNAGITYAEIAEKTGVSPATISGVAKKERATRSTGPQVPSSAPAPLPPQEPPDTPEPPAAIKDVAELHSVLLGVVATHAEAARSGDAGAARVVAALSAVAARCAPKDESEADTVAVPRAELEQAAELCRTKLREMLSRTLSGGDAPDGVFVDGATTAHGGHA